jgi:hypothetical protein
MKNQRVDVQQIKLQLIRSEYNSIYEKLPDEIKSKVVEKISQLIQKWIHLVYDEKKGVHNGK